MTPSATPRKPRTRSRARIELILEAARDLLTTTGVAGLSIYSVAERAQIPPSSVYHFFAGVPALLQALTADIHQAFRACLEAALPSAQPDSWQALARVVDPAARQLILVQHGLSEVMHADRQHDLELGARMQALFERHFELPRLTDEVDVFALAMELGDRVYARSIQLHGEITPRMAEEGMRVFEAYLGLYLPSSLPRRH
jgi:AcrR family transcriptional regulator